MARKRMKGLLQGCLAAVSILVSLPAMAADDEPKFMRTNIQYIAAVAEPDAKSGTGAQEWAIWRQDPGPRGVPLKHFDKLMADNGVSPAGWTFDANDWWVDEYGQLMENPSFPLPPGRYIVTGGREKAAILTIHAPDETGDSRWDLSDDATIYDVTHLKCRAARYAPISDDSGCSPNNVPQNVFTLGPDDVMPTAQGCSKRDYPVLIVVAIGIEDGSPLLQ